MIDAKKLTLWRRLTQLAGISLLGPWSFYGIFRCPFIVPYVSCRNCPVITCHGRLFTMFWGFWLLSNLWCRFVCPTGGVPEWLKSFSLFKVYKTAQCNDCDRCLKICEMDARPAEAGCTNCRDCLSVCSQDAIKIGRRSGRL